MHDEDFSMLDLGAERRLQKAGEKILGFCSFTAPDGREGLLAFSRQERGRDGHYLGLTFLADDAGSRECTALLAGLGGEDFRERLGPSFDEYVPLADECLDHAPAGIPGVRLAEAYLGFTGIKGSMRALVRAILLPLVSERTGIVFDNPTWWDEAPRAAEPEGPAGRADGELARSLRAIMRGA